MLVAFTLREEKSAWGLKRTVLVADGEPAIPSIDDCGETGETTGHDRDGEATL